jgi:hypothetical protein
MFPYSYSCSEFPGDAETLMEAALGVAKSMKTDHGTPYKAGQACDLVYRAAGDSIDYAYGGQKIRWAYSAEMRDTGTVGRCGSALHHAKADACRLLLVRLPAATARDPTDCRGAHLRLVLPSRVHPNDRARSARMRVHA